MKIVNGGSKICLFLEADDGNAVSLTKEQEDALFDIPQVKEVCNDPICYGATYVILFITNTIVTEDVIDVYKQTIHRILKGGDKYDQQSRVTTGSATD